MIKRGLSTGIYMDYQASTPTDARVIAAMAPFWGQVYGNPHAADHAFGWDADDAVEEARGHIAALIGAGSDEIIFTSGATEANNLALLGIARAAPPGRRRIIVSAIEHKCVLAAARAACEEGFEVTTLAVDADGILDPGSVAAALDGTVGLVSVLAINNEIGTVQAITEVAALCEAAGVVFHTDAAQALAVTSIDVDAAGIDLMSLSGHKAYGPKGIGALYIRRDSRLQPRPIIHGGGQERGFRAGTLPTPLCVGFGEACRILRTERDSDVVRMKILRDMLLLRLRGITPGLRVNGAIAPRHPGNLNVEFPGHDAELLLKQLQPYVAASTGSACTTGLPEPSHVLRAIGRSSRQAESSVRFSIGRFTTEKDVDEVANLIEITLSRSRVFE